MLHLVPVCMALMLQGVTPQQRATAAAPAPAAGRWLAHVRVLETDARVAAALDLLRQRDEEITSLQIGFAETPAPDARAALRGALLARELEAAGLTGVRADAAGNIIARLPGAAPGARVVVLSAHLDTVFPDLETIHVAREGTVLRGPGIGDDAAGLAAVVHLVRALVEAGVPLRRDLVIVGTVGEEGEGDLRGVKHFFDHEYGADRVHAFFTLDLGSHAQIVHEALGSRRLRVEVRGPGGHSWGDFGRPNPIHALARGLQRFLDTPPPDGARSSFNVGVIEGGRGVNVIPESASLRMDLRSESRAVLERVESSFRHAMQEGMAREEAWARSTAPLELEVQVLGDRPVGTTPAGSDLVQTLVAAFASQGLPVVLGSSSTDANLPMSRGVPALALPHGVQGHDAHSRSEWCDVSGRPAVLAAELLALVAVAELDGPVLPRPSPTD